MRWGVRLVPAEPRGRVRGREQSGRVAGLSPGELLTDTENELRLGTAMRGITVKNSYYTMHV